MKTLLKPVLGLGLLVGRTLWRWAAPPTQRAPLRASLKRWLRAAVGLGILVALLGFLGAASGIVAIKASSGHWRPTAWFLQFAKTRSVSTHTLGAEPLALAEPWLVLKGAGHYETACRPCHGAPDLAQPRVARAMTPRPPDLAARVRAWKPEQLFYIVKHGIKFTGMPAWPTMDRDDEVRAMVAFLIELPGLQSPQYRRLVHGDADRSGTTEPIMDLVAPTHAVPSALANCRRCHGADGLGRGQAAFPRLAGQRQEYLLRSLQAYARDQRVSGFMQPVAAALTPAEMQELASFYAGLPGALAVGTAGGGASEVKGAEIASRGIPEQGVPACRHCHGPGTQPRNPAYPDLAAQFAEYLVLQLELFKGGRRGGSAYEHVMRRAAARLSRAQMREVAAYYASLPPRTAGRR